MASSGPQKTARGDRASRIMLTAERSALGQHRGTPSGEVPQFIEVIRAPTSPALASTLPNRSRAWSSPDASPPLPAALIVRRHTPRENPAGVRQENRLPPCNYRTAARGVYLNGHTVHYLRPKRASSGADGGGPTWCRQPPAGSRGSRRSPVGRREQVLQIAGWPISIPCFDVGVAVGFGRPIDVPAHAGTEPVDVSLDLAPEGGREGRQDPLQLLEGADLARDHVMDELNRLLETQRPLSLQHENQIVDLAQGQLFVE